MSTGDIKNNLRKLQAELKAVNFTDADFDRLSKGVPEAFLPVYHYVFVDYSRPLAEKIAELNVEMYGKSDVRFVEAMYKVLRELFTYKPPLTKEQFFNPGYSEMKVIMCSDIVGLLKKFHKTSLPKKQKPLKSKTNLSSAAVASAGAIGLPMISKLGPRPTSASIQKATQHQKNGKENKPKSSSSYTVEPRVHSELESPSSPPIRHRSSTSDRQAVEFVYDSYHGDRITIPADLSAIQPVAPLDVKVQNNGSPVKKEQLLPPDDVDIEAIPIDIVASTPCRPLQIKKTEKHEFVGQLNYILKQVQDLTNKLVSVEDRMSSIEQQLSLVTGVQGTNKTAGAMDPAKLENLLARMTLVENKFDIMQAQKDQEQNNGSGTQMKPHPGSSDVSRQEYQQNGKPHDHSMSKEPLQYTGIETTMAETEESRLNKTHKKTSSPIAAAGFKSIHMHEGFEASPSPIVKRRLVPAEQTSQSLYLTKDCEQTSQSLYATKDASSIGELNVAQMDMDSLQLSNVTYSNCSKILDQKQRIASLVLETEKLLNIEGKVADQ